MTLPDCGLKKTQHQPLAPQIMTKSSNTFFSLRTKVVLKTI